MSTLTGVLSPSEELAGLAWSTWGVVPAPHPGCLPRHTAKVPTSVTPTAACRLPRSSEPGSEVSVAALWSSARDSAQWGRGAPAITSVAQAGNRQAVSRWMPYVT